MTRFVLDSWAVLAWLGREEPAATRVAQLFEAADRGDVELFIGLVNAGEIHYTLGRREGPEVADTVRQRLQASPMQMVSVDDALVWAAARLKAQVAFAYGDAFAAALALRMDAPLVTGDPEFALMEPRGLTVEWLERS